MKSFKINKMLSLEVLTCIHAGLLCPIGYGGQFTNFNDLFIALFIFSSAIQSNNVISRFYSGKYCSSRSSGIGYLLIHVVSLQIRNNGETIMRIYLYLLFNTILTINNVILIEGNIFLCLIDNY